ncbi:MAG: hypothetical protein HN403_15875 [Rhodospirillales bacterium]|jgi:flagellar basal body-associated protein FliL|nr:hypothetical protein [Rhodospirillales bacterium]
MIRTIAIAVAVLLMVAGGAIGVMKQFEWGPFAPGDGNADTAAADSEKPPEPPRFIDMDALVVPVFAGDAPVGTIQIQIKLETLGAENEEALHRLMPRISDAFLSDLYVYIPRLLRKTGNVDVIAIKQRLQAVATKTAGKGRVENVLVQSVTETGKR